MPNEKWLDTEEERQWQKLVRELEKTSAELGIKQKKKEIEEWRSPGWKEAMRILGEERQHQYRLKEDAAQESARAKTQKEILTLKPAKSAADWDKEYLSDATAIATEHNKNRWLARKAKSDAESGLNNNIVFYMGNPAALEADRKKIDDSYQESLKIIDEQEKVANSKLEQLYEGLPRLKNKSKSSSAPGPIKIKGQAKSSAGRVVDVWSEDGGKTWKDKDGNTIPIGK